MPKYATKTSVASDRSKAEIEKTLMRYGADQFAYGWSGDDAVVAFAINGRAIKVRVPMPDRNDDEFWNSPTGKKRTHEVAMRKWEQAGRQRWRALLLVIKAKLEAIESGISTFEDEFLAFMVLSDGRTVGDSLGVQIRAAIDDGGMLPKALLPGVVE